MTGYIEITAIVPKIQYTATAGQTSFDYPFIAFSDEDLAVYVNETKITTFTVTNLYPNEGGTITLNSGAALNDVVTIIRNTPLVKDTGYTTGGDFRASTLDAQYAKFIAMIQQLSRDVSNTLKLSPSSTLNNGIELPEPVDGRSFKWSGVDGTIVNTDNDVDEVVTTATAQAVIATTQAGLATTAAGNASTSETNAQGYASTASTAKDDALLAQTAAETAQGLAEDARDLAQTYANDADVAKIEWQGAWSAGSYNEHDAVENGGTSYIANKNTSEEPSVTAVDWDILALKGSGDMTNPMTAVGDVIIGGAGGTPERYGIGSAGTVLKSNGTSVVYDDPLPIAAAGGTVDAITATYTTGVVTLADKMQVRVVAAGANTSTTPTFAPNGLTAHTIVKQGGVALAAGDIKGAGHVLDLVYDLTNTRWELLNPAVSGGSGVTNFFTECSTASATAEKSVVCSGFSLVAGATILVSFTNANTSSIPTLNVNSTGAKAICSEAGTVVSANNPFYVPAGATVEFTYNGTAWVYKNRIVSNYVNGTEWYRQWANGWIEQGGLSSVYVGQGTKTITFLKTFKDTNYTPLLAWGEHAAGGTANVHWQSKTTTTLTFYGDHNVDVATFPVSWTAAGY